MKVTGPSNPRTRELIVTLDKHGKASKAQVFRTLAKMLQGPSRGRAEVNVEHLNTLAEKNKEKVFVVPGKVMGKGDVSHKVEVAALGFSQTAKDKITAHKGSVMTLQDLVENKIPASRVVLVK